MRSDLEKLKELISDSTVVVCVGNELRRDDGVGPYIANKLKEKGFNNVINAGTNPEFFTNELTNSRIKRIIFIDGIIGLNKPGDIIITPIEELKSKNVVILTTHNIPLTLIANYIKFFNPEVKIFLLGIQIKDTSFGRGLSKEVREAADKIVETILASYKTTLI